MVGLAGRPPDLHNQSDLPQVADTKPLVTVGVAVHFRALIRVYEERLYGGMDRFRDEVASRITPISSGLDTYWSRPSRQVCPFPT